MKNYDALKNTVAKLFVVASVTSPLYACQADSSDAMQKGIAASRNTSTTEVKTTSSSASESMKKPSAPELSSNAKTQFETATGLTLPENAKISFYESAEGLDQMVSLIAEMTAQDFKNWLPNLYLDTSHFSEEKRYLLGSNIGEWQPQTPKKLPTAQVLFENAKTLNIGYENQVSENVKIYLVFHGS